MNENINLSEIEKVIIKTISHFDVLNYPLTVIETYKHLAIKTDLFSLKKELVNLTDKKIISVKNGFYFLNGREEILKIRHDNYRLFLKKIKIAERAISFLIWFPWIKAIAIYNSLSYKYSKIGSDIDLFIITNTNRAWSSRFFLNLILKLFSLRPSSKKKDNKLCLSYWVNENNINLLGFAYDKDYSYNYYLNNFIFLTEDNLLNNKFFSENNWLKIITPNWQPINFINKKETNHLKKILESVLGLISESFYKKIQLKILPNYYQDAKDGKKVILSDHTIKLHDKDKRQEYNRLFKENYEKTLANINN